MTAGSVVPTNIEVLPLSEAALHLGLRYQTCLDWLYLGRLQGGKRNGRWMVTVESLQRAQRERAASSPSPAA